MKLEVYNFRCYKGKKVFEFPDEGVVLLQGHSGSGKTSILKAINFALYGKEHRLITFNESKMYVIFHYKQYRIKRTKGPVHLLFEILDEEGKVDIKLQDDPAQKKIDEIFGVHFTLTNYLTQKGLETFLSCKKEDRKEFLQQLIAQHFPIEEKRELVKNEIRQRKQHLHAVTNQLFAIQNEMNSENIQEVNKPIFPFTTKKFDSIDNRIYHESELYKKLDQQNKLEKHVLDSLLIQQKTYHEKMIESEKYRIYQNQYQDQLKQYKQEIEQLKDIDISKIQKQIQFKQSQLDFIEKIERIKELEDESHKLFTKYQSLYDQNKLKLEQEIQSIEIISKDKLDEYQLITDQYQKCLSICKEFFISFPSQKSNTNIKQLIEFCQQFSKKAKITYCEKQTQIKDVEDTITQKKTEQSKTKSETERIKVELQGKTYKCPTCSESLMVKNSCLMKHDTDVLKKDLILLQEKQYKLEEEIVIYEQNKKQWVDESSKQLLIQERTNNFEKRFVQLSDSLKIPDEKLIQERLVFYKQQIQLQNQYSMLKQQLTKLVLPSEELSYKDKIKQIQSLKMMLKEQIETDKEQLIILKQQINHRLNLEKEIINIEQQLKNIQIKLKYIEGLSNPEQEIHQVQKRITSINDKIVRTNQRKEKIDEYQRQMEIFERWIRYNNRVQKLKKDETCASRAYQIALKFIQIMDQEESTCLRAVVDAINLLLEEYVESFFDDNIRLEMVTTKESQNHTSTAAKGDQRPTLEVKITRDEQEVPIDTLSGGEYDRVVLALFLCFNRYSNNEFMMLDECLSSIHAEAVEKIVDFIREKNPNKLVIMTLHQANTGFFDHVIDICCI